MKTSFSAPRKHSAFTLVEVLVVVAVIAVLASVTVGLLGPVQTAILTANAKTQRDKLTLALSQFKDTYGEFPMAEGEGSDTEWRQLLVDSLRGDKILVRRKGQMQVIDYTDGRSGAEKRPFLSLADFTLDDDSVENATQILDPWDNPWCYRYNYISGGKPGKDWNGTTFLLISAGPEYNEPVEGEDYFAGDMEKTGMPELNPDGSDYYFSDARADNIVNFGEQ